MKSRMHYQRLMKEHEDPAGEFDVGAFKVTTKIVVAQVAVALVIALTVNTFVDGGDATLAVSATPDRAPVTASASTYSRETDSRNPDAGTAASVD